MYKLLIFICINLFIPPTGLSDSSELFLSNRNDLKKYDFRFDDLLNRRALTSLTKTLENEVALERHTLERSLGPSIKHVSFFDPQWINHKNLKFELIGIVDRYDTHLTGESPCGMVRLIYRPRYYDAPTSLRSSFLPLTFAFNFHPKSCSQPTTSGPLTAKLNVLMGENWSASKLEMNIQISRIPGFKGKNGHESARYLLVNFNLLDGRLVQALLFNTPDHGRISKEPSLKSEFKKLILNEATRVQVRNGTFILPEKFLASRAVSTSPFGLKRLSNRPYTSLMLDAWNDLKHRPMLRKLDGLSCQGCHQSRAVAGFHFLGEGTDSDPAFNRIDSPTSPHFAMVQEWRHVVSKSKGQPVAIMALPVPDQPLSTRSTYGETCDPTFNWRCGEGLTCQTATPESFIFSGGACLPTQPASGSPCDRSKLLTSSEGSKDRHNSLLQLTCGQEAVCATTLNGFPGGMCSFVCANGSSKKSGETCSPVPKLGPFTACMQEGGEFKKCLEGHSVVHGLRACKSHADCRSDYVCAGKKTEGACVPLYTLPQLAIEAHKF